ncbi:MAG: twin-arginine translocase TatA/TatE family subunit [Phycisphaerales bacterium]
MTFELFSTPHLCPGTTTLAFIPNIGMTEWIIILVIMLLLFGRRLPEVGKSLGKGIVEFKKGLKGVEEEIEQQSNQRTAPPAPPPTIGQWQSQQQVSNLPPGAEHGQPETVSRASQVESEPPR